MAELDFNDVVDLICREDPRYGRNAYRFVREGLGFLMGELKRSKQAPRHVAAPELLDGLRMFALNQFGPLSFMVLESWGLRTCADFGELVFNLIEYRVFSKSEGDRREDFAAGYDFHDAFVKPFLPEKRVEAERVVITND